MYSRLMSFPIASLEAQGAILALQNLGAASGFTESLALTSDIIPNSSLKNGQSCHNNESRFVVIMMISIQSSLIINL